MAGVLLFASAICNTNHDIQASKEKPMRIKMIGVRDRIEPSIRRYSVRFIYFNLMKTASYMLPVFACASRERFDPVQLDLLVNSEASTYACAITVDSVRCHRNDHVCVVRKDWPGGIPKACTTCICVVGQPNRSFRRDTRRTTSH